MDQSIETINIKTELSEIEVNSVKQEADSLVQSEVFIKTEPYENEYPVMAGTLEMCSPDNIKFEMIEPEIEIANKNEEDKFMLDPLAVKTEIKELLPPKKRTKRSPIGRAEKEIILNMYESLLEENPDCLIRDIVKKVAECTGVGTTTVFKIIREYKKEKRVSSPVRKKPRKLLIDCIDNFDKNAIRKKVHDFFLRNELPTMDKVLNEVNEDEKLPNFKRTTFHALLKKLNFKYMRCGRYSTLIEKEEIITWRRNFLRSIRCSREESKPIYYLGETWINAGKECPDEDTKENSTQLSNIPETSNSSESLPDPKTRTLNSTGNQTKSKKYKRNQDYLDIYMDIVIKRQKLFQKQLENFEIKKQLLKLQVKQKEEEYNFQIDVMRLEAKKRELDLKIKNKMDSLKK